MHFLLSIPTKSRFSDLAEVRFAFLHERAKSLASSGLTQHATEAGTFLGLNRDQIRYRIEKFGLTTVPTP